MSQRWIEAYMCSMQCVAEASVGWYWTAEDGTMTPEVSNLVETFMAMTGMLVSPYIVRECWPLLREETPQQDLRGV